MFQKFLDECFYSFELTKLQFNKFLEKIKKVAYSFLYLNPTAACHTNANRRKSTGIAGITSTIGRNAAYASGRYDIKKFTFILLLTLYTILQKIKYLRRLYIR